jgi:hypothetical protein
MNDSESGAVPRADGAVPDRAADCLNELQHEATKATKTHEGIGSADRLERLG